MSSTGDAGSIGATSERLKGHVDRRRLLAIAGRLIAVPSPTGRAGAASEALAAVLTEEGFAVDRPPAGHPDTPAVVARLAHTDTKITEIEAERDLELAMRIRWEIG